MQIEDRQRQFLKGLEELSRQTGVTMAVQNQPEQLNNGVVQIRASIALVQVEGWTEPQGDRLQGTDVNWLDGTGDKKEPADDRTSEPGA